MAFIISSAAFFWFGLRQTQASNRSFFPAFQPDRTSSLSFTAFSLYSVGDIFPTCRNTRQK